jgi:hypothetical protein
MPVPGGLSFVVPNQDAPQGQAHRSDDPDAQQLPDRRGRPRAQEQHNDDEREHHADDNLDLTLRHVRRPQMMRARTQAMNSATTMSLAGHCLHPHAAGMFVVTEAEAAVIRTAFEQQGEMSAAIELRRLFPGITDNVQARECARVIAGWKPLASHPPRLLRGQRREP